jgi:hypothetical protein
MAGIVRLLAYVPSLQLGTLTICSAASYSSSHDHV